jgi:hypothetical protein
MPVLLGAGKNVKVIGLLDQYPRPLTRAVCWIVC